MKSPVLVVFLLLSAVAAIAQTENARLSGRVTDLSGAVIVDVQCKITNIETDVSVTLSGRIGTFKFWQSMPWLNDEPRWIRHHYRSEPTVRPWRPSVGTIHAQTAFLSTPRAAAFEAQEFTKSVC